MFREDGYINMTKAAKHYGKKVHEFLRLDSTDDYMTALEELMEGKGGIFPPLADTGTEGIPSLTFSTKGRYGGTYCHPKLAVFFARWLDVRFAVWCDLMLDNILRGSLEVSVVEPTEEALMLFCCGFRAAQD